LQKFGLSSQNGDWFRTGLIHTGRQTSKNTVWLKSSKSSKLSGR
jgi:hypothetical protein